MAAAGIFRSSIMRSVLAEIQIGVTAESRTRGGLYMASVFEGFWVYLLWAW